MSRRPIHPAPRALATLAALAALAGLPAAAAGQPMDVRSPNLEGTWTPAAHDLFFQFSHRFQVAGQDADIGDLFADGKVVNYPTFALSYGLFEAASAGFRYSSNSLIAGKVNEWQPFVKVAPLARGEEGGLSLSVLAAWNDANQSADGELSAQYVTGALTLLSAFRAFSDPLDRPPGESEAELAAGAGASLRLNEYVSLSGDYANMFTQDDAQIGWSAGVSVEIPYTPHTFALYATNVTSGTLEGLSVGADETTFWGFEFTIRLSGQRWGRIFEPDPPPPEPAGEDPAEGDPSEETPPEETPAPDGEVVEIVISDLSYGRTEVTVAPGTTVRWVNRDPVAHTATADDDGWSSPMLEEGGTYERVFREPGRHPYHCTPHPFMQGVVVVEEGS